MVPATVYNTGYNNIIYIPPMQPAVGGFARSRNFSALDGENFTRL